MPSFVEHLYSLPVEATAYEWVIEMAKIAVQIALAGVAAWVVLANTRKQQDRLFDHEREKSAEQREYERGEHLAQVLRQQYCAWKTAGIAAVASSAGRRNSTKLAQQAFHHQQEVFDAYTKLEHPESRAECEHMLQKSSDRSREEIARDEYVQDQAWASLARFENETDLLLMHETDDEMIGAIEAAAPNVRANYENPAQNRAEFTVGLLDDVLKRKVERLKKSG